MKKYLLIAILFLSCNTVKKQRERAVAFYANHPVELAEKCANEFPPKVVNGDAIIVRDTTIEKDTVVIKDSVKCPDGTVIEVPVERVKLKTVYVEKLRVDTVENTARIKELEGKLTLAKYQIEDLNVQVYKEKRDCNLKMLVGSLIAFVLCIVLLFKTKKT